MLPALKLYCSVMFSVKWVKVHGTLYKDSGTLLIGMKNDLPLFGNIQRILVIKEEVYFEVKLFETLSYSTHYHAFLVSLGEFCPQIVCQSDLLNHIPLHARSISGLSQPGQKAIILKFHISTL